MYFRRWLGLLPHRQPPFLFPDPEMAGSRPWSRTSWGCSLTASRHPYSLTLRWPIAVPGCDCSLIAKLPFLFPVPELANSCPCLWLLPHRKPPLLRKCARNWACLLGSFLPRRQTDSGNFGELIFVPELAAEGRSTGGAGTNYSFPNIHRHRARG